MPNFVWDNTSPPGVKVDNAEEVIRTASIPANQKYPAADYNNLRQITLDVRTAMQAGGVQMFNPVRYGALGDYAQDDSSAVQAAYDAAAAVGGGILYLPPPAVRYRMGKPLLAHSTNLVRIIGPGPDVPCLGTSDFAGPLIFACPDYDGLPLTTSKLTGGGLAADFRSTTLGSRTDRLRFDLRWGIHGDINGWSQFCYETMYTPQPADSSLRALVSGRTTMLPSDGVHRAVEIVVDGRTGAVSAVLKVGGVEKTLSSAFTMTMDGTKTYHIALTYDGSTVRLFVAEKGTRSPVRDSVAASGTITQDGCEDLCIGRNEFFSDPHGIVDFAYLSNAARYTGTFTAPSVKRTESDVNHRIMLNFNENPDSSGRLIGALLMAGHGSGGIPAALPVETLEYTAQVTLSLEGIHISGALYTINSVGIAIRDCTFSGGRYGIFLDNNSFQAKLQNVRTENVGRFALRTLNAVGVSSIENFQANGAGDHSVWLKHFQGKVDGLYLGANKLPLVVDATGSSGGICTLDNVAIANEGYGSSPRAMAAFVQPSGISCNSSIFQALNGITAPLILVDASASGKETPLTFVSCCFDVDTNASKFAFLNASPVKGSVLVINPLHSPFLPDDTIPWSDPIDLVTVVQDGQVTNTTGISGTDTPARNLRGSVTINAGSTSASVTFATAEADANYRVSLGAGVGSGSPAPGSLRASWASKGTGGFTINIEADPGVGASVVVDWELIR